MIYEWVGVELFFLSGGEVAMVRVKPSLQQFREELSEHTSSVYTWFIQALGIDQHHLQRQPQVWVGGGVIWEIMYTYICTHVHVHNTK